MSYFKKGRELMSFEYAVKILLRNKANYDVLEGFLSELFKHEVKIKNLIRSDKTCILDRSNRFDVLAENDKGEIILIELQFSLEVDYFQRTLYGTSKAICKHLLQENKDVDAKKIYSIDIVYFDIGEGKDYVYYGKTCFCGSICFRGLYFDDELRLPEAQYATFKQKVPGDILPEYYIIKIRNFNDHIEDTLDEWIYFLKNNEIKDEFKAKGLKRTKEISEYRQLTEEEECEYEALQWDRSHQRSQYASAKLEGELESRAKARKEKERETTLAELDAAIARERAEKEAALAELAALKARLNGEVRN
jgi:hypothetical protein